MTQQCLDTIMIGGQNHWLANTALILPPGHEERIGLELEPQSTANYKGWAAHWAIEDGRLCLAELWVHGFLARRKLKKYEECANDEEYRAVMMAYGTPRRISFEEIFGSEPPIFANWVSQKLVAISTHDDTQYRRDHADGVTGAFMRLVTVDKGLVISDETVPNPHWEAERSEHRRLKSERTRAIRAAEEFERSRKARLKDSN